MKYLKYVFLAFTILCIGFIWINSSFDAVESSGLSGAIVDFIENIVHIHISETIIRKLAHFTEFAGLGFLLTSDFVFYGLDIKRHWHNIAFLGLLIAAVDETIQLFPYGRSSSVVDVWIDFAGICCAIVITCLLYKCINIKGLLGQDLA